jgi:hypothetical protein
LAIFPAYKVDHLINQIGISIFSTIINNKKATVYQGKSRFFFITKT